MRDRRVDQAQSYIKMGNAQGPPGAYRQGVAEPHQKIVGRVPQV